ncbi:MAG: hypothetical protein ACREL9_08690 [Gemmatimonadales bacterium]
MKPYGALLGVGAALIGVAIGLGGVPAGIGGAVAMVAQVAAVALLRPAMRAPQPVFLGRWLGGMAIRALALGLVLGLAATHRDLLPPLSASLGYLGVLLPLLFLETRFLK